MSKLTSFLQEAKQEFARVNWPTKQETLKMLGIVFTLCLFMAFFLGAFDYGFLKGVQILTTPR